LLSDLIKTPQESRLLKFTKLVSLMGVFVGIRIRNCRL